MPVYHVTVGGQTYEVTSDHELSDVEAHQHAMTSIAPAGAPHDARPIDPSEPDTWWGGFTKHMLKDEKPAVAALASAPAVLASPVIGGGLIGAGAANAITAASPTVADGLSRLYDLVTGRSQEPISSGEVLADAAGPLMTYGPGAAVKAAKYVGESPRVAKVLAGLTGGATGATAGVPFGGAAGGVGGAVLGAKKGAEMSPILQQAASLIGGLDGHATPGEIIAGGEEAAAAAPRPVPNDAPRPAGWRSRGSEVPYRAGGGTSDPFAPEPINPTPRMPSNPADSSWPGMGPDELVRDSRTPIGEHPPLYVSGGDVTPRMPTNLPDQSWPGMGPDSRPLTRNQAEFGDAWPASEDLQAAPATRVDQAIEGITPDSLLEKLGGTGGDGAKPRILPRRDEVWGPGSQKLDESLAQAGPMKGDPDYVHDPRSANLKYDPQTPTSYLREQLSTSTDPAVREFLVKSINQRRNLESALEGMQ